jgi:hypothetical protein
MIVIDSGSPRWLRELARFLPLKNLLFVHGNILDLISYPVRQSGSDKVYWTESDLPRFFDRFLTGMKYEVVGIFDPVDGLTFSTPEMEDAFHRIRSGRADGLSSAARAPQPAGIRKAETLPRAGRRNIDLDQAVEGIRIVLRNNMVPCAFVFDLASRLATSPTHLTRDERAVFTRLLKASLESSDVFRDRAQWKNVIILICDKLNDLPPFLYLNNPRARSILIERPDTIDRSRFIRRTYHAFYRENPGTGEPSAEFVSLFAALTEGLTH